MNKAKNQHKGNKLNKLYPMDSFGVVAGFTKQIRVTRLEKRLNPIVAFPHKHNFYHIVMMTKGSGIHEIDFKRYKAQAGSVFLMLPSQVHSWSFSEETEGIVVEFENLNMFSGEEALVLQTALNPKINHFDAKNKIKDEFILIAQSMLTEYENELDDFEVLLRLKLAEFLIHYKRQSEHALKNNDNKSDTKSAQFRLQINELIEKHYKVEHSVEFYAKELVMNPKSLTAKVNRIFGKTFRDLIQERCLLESKRLLAYSNYSILEIARELGFEDANYFSRFFRLKLKENPTSFRNKVRHIC